MFEITRRKTFKEDERYKDCFALNFTELEDDATDSDFFHERWKEQEKNKREGGTHLRTKSYLEAQYLLMITGIKACMMEAVDVAGSVCRVI